MNKLYDTPDGYCLFIRCAGAAPTRNSVLLRADTKRMTSFYISAADVSGDTARAPFTLVRTVSCGQTAANYCTVTSVGRSVYLLVSITAVQMIECSTTVYRRKLCSCCCHCQGALSRKLCLTQTRNICRSLSHECN